MNGNTTGRINYAGDVDGFKATLTAGHTYTIDLKGAPSSSGTLADPSFQGVYPASGALIPATANDDFGTSRESHTVFTPSGTGTYYFAAGAYGSNTGTYTLKIAETTVTDIGATVATAGTIAVNGRVSSVINTSGDLDWFRVTLTAGKTYIIDEISDQTSSNPLRDPFFRGISDANGTPDAQSSIAITTTGTYFLAVGAENDGSGTYRLSIETNNVNTDIPDNSTTAAVVVSGDPYRGQVDSPQDVDWIKVSLTANTTYHIQELGSPSGNGTLSDPYIFGIYNAAGQSYPGTANDDEGSGRDAGIIFTAPVTGDYFVAAGAYGNNTGSYALRLSTVTDTTAPTLVSATPADNAGSVDPAANISLNFNEPVKAGTGNIVITGGRQHPADSH